MKSILPRNTCDLAKGREATTPHQPPLRRKGDNQSQRRSKKKDMKEKAESMPPNVTSFKRGDMNEEMTKK